MQHFLWSLTGSLLLVPLVCGCGKPGIDAEVATQGGPKQTEHRSQAEQVQQFIKDLQKTGKDAPDSRQATMYITMLGKMGAEAEPALPVLEKIAGDSAAVKQTRESAKSAIEYIKAAIDN